MLADVQVTSQQIDKAACQAREHLLSLQHPEGYWVGELEADVSVSAGYILLLYFMNGAVDSDRQRKVVNLLKQKQQPDGGWSMYAGGPGDLNVSIQAYLALKLAGVSAQEPFLERARKCILAQGGIGKANVFTKIWLAVFGQFDWRGVPTSKRPVLQSEDGAPIYREMQISPRTDAFRSAPWGA